MRAASAPIVGIPCDTFEKGVYPFHGVGEKYINAVAHGASVMPLLIPALGRGRDIEPIADLVNHEQLLGMLDGLFFTGSPSNVEPAHYGGPASAPGTLHDPQRDETTLPLIRLALEYGIPILCVCRGFQELNVALGGTLHQRVQELPGMMDHREDEQASRDLQYAEAHDMLIEEGGLMAGFLPERRYRVNSLHWQGVDRVAPGLRVEARAPDGLVEALSARDSKAFCIGVQWHPEWQFRTSPLSSALFAAFGAAVMSRYQSRGGTTT